jgi:hypothetical protein
VAELLRRHLAAGVFATALENTPRNAISGLLAKQRGTRTVLPDWLIICGGANVFIELKSRRGVASKVQRQVRDELLAAGVKFWWLARTPRACLMALHRSGVPLINWSCRRRSSGGKGLLKIRMHGCRSIRLWRGSEPPHSSDTGSIDARERPQWRLDLRGRRQRSSPFPRSSGQVTYDH